MKNALNAIFSIHRSELKATNTIYLTGTLWRGSQSFGYYWDIQYSVDAGILFLLLFHTTNIRWDSRSFLLHLTKGMFEIFENYLLYINRFVQLLGTWVYKHVPPHIIDHSMDISKYLFVYMFMSCSTILCCRVSL